MISFFPVRLDYSDDIKGREIPERINQKKAGVLRPAFYNYIVIDSVVLEFIRQT